MKKYLFGLGAMLVGAGLMFVLMHTEVSADSKSENHCERFPLRNIHDNVLYCRFKDLTCAIAIKDTGEGTKIVREMSCVFHYL